MLREVRFRGFSFTELMVALVLTTIVIFVFAVGLRRLNSQREVALQRTEFFRRVSQFKETLREDLRIALINNGYTSAVNLDSSTGNQFAGISTLSVTEGSSLLQIYRPFYQGLTLPIQINSNFGKILGLNLQNPNGQFMKDAVQVGSFFSVTNNSKQIIFERAVVQSQENGALVGEPTSFISSTIPFLQGITDFNNTTNLIRSAERVRYRYDAPRKALIRSSQYRQNQSEDKVILSEIRRFVVGYTFADRDHSGIILPPTPLSGFDADDLPKTFEEAWTISECSDSPLVNNQVAPSCVKPKDIDRLYIKIEVETHLPQSAVLMASSDDYDGVSSSFAVDSANQLNIATLRFSINAESFDRQLGTSLASGEEVTCDPTVANRCKQECSSAFKNLDPTMPDWVGYGRYRGHPQGSSSFCECWTDPESGEVIETGDWTKIPQWDSDSLNTQVTACGVAYGCVNAVKNKHPGYRLACDCLRGSTDDPEKFVALSAEAAPRFESLNSSELGGYHLKTELSQYQGDGNSVPLTNALNRNLRCSDFRSKNGLSMSCDAAAQEYFNTTKSPFEERCGCLTFDIPYVCDTESIASGQAPSGECLGAGSELIKSQHLDFAKLCNKAYRNNPSSGSLSCPNTWVPSENSVPSLAPFNAQFDFWSQLNVTEFNGATQKGGAYNLNNLQGSFLSRFRTTAEVAKACECLEGALEGRYDSNNYVDVVTATNLNQFDYAAFPLDYDFRDINNSPNGITPPSSIPSYASNVSKEIPEYFIAMQVPWVDVTSDQCVLQGNGPTYTCPNPSGSGTLSPCMFMGGSQYSCYAGLTTSLIPQTSQSSGGSCSDVFCAISPGPSCCVAKAVGSNSAVEPAFQGWNGYCDSSCKSATNSQSLNDEIDVVRRLITNTQSGEPLPPSCGGSAQNPSGDFGTPAF